ncbi:hypothetical protein RFI_24435, partial [Reticulomyxa filosa]
KKKKKKKIYTYICVYVCVTVLGIILGVIGKAVYGAACGAKIGVWLGLPGLLIGIAGGLVCGTVIGVGQWLWERHQKKKSEEEERLRASISEPRTIDNDSAVERNYSFDGQECDASLPCLDGIEKFSKEQSEFHKSITEEEFIESTKKKMQGHNDIVKQMKQCLDKIEEMEAEGSEGSKEIEIAHLFDFCQDDAFFERIISIIEYFIEDGDDIKKNIDSFWKVCLKNFYNFVVNNHKIASELLSFVEIFSLLFFYPFQVVFSFFSYKKKSKGITLKIIMLKQKTKFKKQDKQDYCKALY